MPQVFHREPELVRSFDDTAIAVHTGGCEPDTSDSLPILLCNGVGANLALWRKSLIDLARERCVVTWDHRGLYESAAPMSDRIDAPAHAEDAIAALDHVGADRFAVVAWSSGGRIALEIASRYPERLASVAFVCAGYGHPIGRALRHLEFASLLPMFAGVAKHFAGPLRDALSSLVARPELAGLLRQTGQLAPTADTAALVELMRGIASCDLRLLLGSYEAVAGDPAPELLIAVTAPALIIAGANDQVTSRAVMEHMERSLPSAELITYERASHYLPIEYPARLSDDLRRFFSQHPAEL